MFAELVATDSAPLVRAEAAKHVIMDPQAQTMGQVLFKAIEDENHMVRRHAVMALARIGDAARPAMSQLVQLLNDPDEYVCCAAATAIHILNADSEPPITVLVQMLKDEDPITRQWAAAVLGDLRAEEAVPYLREILQDEPQATFDEWKQTMEGRAREEAEKALAKIEP
jgi:HEAT repeat protein